MTASSKTKLKQKFRLEDYLNLDKLETEFQMQSPTIRVGAELLTLSCTLYRLQVIENKPEIQYCSLDYPELHKEITEKDRLLAKEIKKFYQQKLIMLKLQGCELTKYRKDLEYFLNNLDSCAWELDSKEKKLAYPQEFFGLAHKLPHFYFYDLKLKEMFGSDYVDIVGNQCFAEKLKLTFLQCLQVNTIKRSVIEFWFVDEKNNKVCIEILNNNPLSNLFLNYIKDNKISIESTFTVRKRDNLSFLVPLRLRWNIVF